MRIGTHITDHFDSRTMLSLPSLCFIIHPCADNDTSNKLTNTNDSTPTYIISDEYDNATANAAQRSIAIRSNAMKSQEDNITSNSGNGSTSTSLASSPQIEVTTLFVTDEYGILMQDSFPLEHPLNALLGIQVIIHV
jgi:hypothetical protein